MKAQGKNKVRKLSKHTNILYSTKNNAWSMAHYRPAARNSSKLKPITYNIQRVIEQYEHELQINQMKESSSI